MTVYQTAAAIFGLGIIAILVDFLLLRRFVGHLVLVIPIPHTTTPLHLGTLCFMVSVLLWIYPYIAEVIKLIF